ncbi:hypothetical protein [Halorubrum sp. CSM-61]|uniref:hypothetical protein n=1 Tax=Halorubrum sp. CSM-61 TaxID=2485838 RepID=UPI0013DE4394|nr:hypothetical protein [Halorubrum sp. CSM-61]
MKTPTDRLTFGVLGTAGTIVTRIAPAELRGEAVGVSAALSALAGEIGGIAGTALVLALRGISSRTRIRLEEQPPVAGDD